MLYVKNNNATYFDSLGVEDIPKEIKKNINRKNVIVNKVRPEIFNFSTNNPVFYPFSIKTNKCSSNCNNISDPYAKFFVSDIVKSLNINVFNLRDKDRENVFYYFYLFCIIFIYIYFYTFSQTKTLSRKNIGYKPLY